MLNTHRINGQQAEEGTPRTDKGTLRAEIGG